MDRHQLYDYTNSTEYTNTMTIQVFLIKVSNFNTVYLENVTD